MPQSDVPRVHQTCIPVLVDQRDMMVGLQELLSDRKGIIR
jgi:hypothetical protein